MRQAILVSNDAHRLVRQRVFRFLFMLCALFCASSAMSAAQKMDRSYIKGARQYGFNVTLDVTFPRDVTGTLISVDKLESELDRFFEALDLLTVSFMKKTGLNVVLIADHLKLKGTDVGGIAHGKTIYLRSGFTATTVYHELFHIVDPDREVRAWTKLNPKGFIYKGSTYYSADLTLRKQRQVLENDSTDQMSVHFVSDYAQSFEHEDRADAFAYMVCEGPQFLKRCAKSDVIKKKMEYIKHLTSRSSFLGRDYWDKRFGLAQNTAPIR